MSDTAPCNVDASVLADPANEEKDAFKYHLNALGHLVNVLYADPALRKTPLFDRALGRIAYWATDEDARDNAIAREVLFDTVYLAAVGKALWYIGDKRDPQRRVELDRLARDPGQEVGTQFLFYVAGVFAAKGYEVEFVPERGGSGKKTPDLNVSKGGKTHWVEANAKQPTRPIDTPEKLWQLIRDIIAEKKQKFVDPQYSPGVIVADISPAQHLINETGKPPYLKLRADLCRMLGDSLAEGFLYPLYEDAEWRDQPENQGNVFAYLTEEFAGINRDRYHVAQCLVTITRHVYIGDGKVAFPRGHQLIVERASEADALVDLSRHVYVVERTPHGED